MSRLRTCPACRTSSASRSNSVRVSAIASSPPRHRPPGQVDDERTDLEPLGLVRSAAGPAQRGANAGHQLGHLERLAHVVVRAGLETDHDIERVGARGEHHDRDRRRPPDRAADLEAVQPRQHDVEQDQVERLGPEPVEALPAVAGGLDREARLPAGRWRSLHGSRGRPRRAGSGRPSTASCGPPSSAGIGGSMPVKRRRPPTLPGRRAPATAPPRRRRSRALAARHGSAAWPAPRARTRRPSAGTPPAGRPRRRPPR